MKKLFVILFLSFIFYPLSLSAAHAQAALNLTVFPATIDLVSQPGSTVTQKIRIRNNTSTPIDLSVKTSKLATTTQGDVVPVDSNDSYLSWISYTPSSFTARPNEWTDITVQIKIPDTAAFGYYYAIRISPTNGAIQNKTNGSTLIGQALVPLLLNVQKPGATAALRLVSFTPSSSLFEYLPATFTITFSNTGNIHIRPQGNVFIRTGNTDTAVLDFNPGYGALLPGQKRSFTANWNDGFLVQEPVIQDGTVLRDKTGNPQTHLVIHWDRLTAFRIGKYSAHLLAVYDNGTRDVPIEATVTFWVFPWKIVLGAVAAVIVIVFCIKLWLSWYVKRQIRKHNTK